MSALPAAEVAFDSVEVAFEGHVADLDLRTFMTSFPTGVTVVTTTDGEGRPRGMTCSSLCSVSLDPPILSISLRQGSPTLEAVLRTGRFAVNLLHEEAEDVARHFASGVPDKFDDILWTQPCRAAGPRLLTSTIGFADLVVTQSLAVGDHHVVFGEVVGLQDLGGDPLVHGRRRFARWSGMGAGHA